MKHSHYKKPVRGLEFVDVYRVLELFGVTDQAIGHAIKKLLCPGQRGSKTVEQDVQEAIDTLMRWQEMRGEDGRREKIADMHDQLMGMRGNGEQAAVRTLEQMGYTFNGGQLWKPPLGSPPDYIINEPAAEIDDESERQQRIQQSGEMAEQVYHQLYGDKKCLACGEQGGHGGLQCPTLRVTS